MSDVVILLICIAFIIMLAVMVGDAFQRGYNAGYEAENIRHLQELAKLRRQYDRESEEGSGLSE